MYDIIVIIIIIIMFLKGQACFLSLDPQDDVGPSISSSVVLCFFVLLVYNLMLVLVVCLCPCTRYIYIYISYAVFDTLLFYFITTIQRDESQQQ